MKPPGKQADKGAELPESKDVEDKQEALKDKGEVVADKGLDKHELTDD